MKWVVAIVLVAAFLVAGWVWYRFNGGVSHRGICEVVRGESASVRETVEHRYRDLDRRLDRIEGKLDRLLKIAERPLPDGMERGE